MTTRAHRVAVIGAGYVGLTTAACLASLGHRVRCADRDTALIERLRRGQVHILEPGLEDLVCEGLAAGSLRFDGTACDAVAEAESVFLCLPTPAGPAGTPDVSAVMTVTAQIADALGEAAALIVKSTVPPGTAARITALLHRTDVLVISNPEFLREGNAVLDFLHPDRIVIGCDTDGAAGRVAVLYAKIAAPVVFTSTASAELAKYAANSFLALKLSYINEIADLCERTGADIGEVRQVLGHDPRIGASHLRPGPGWGGPCLPKDLTALLHVASAVGSELGLLQAAQAANRRQQRRVVAKASEALGGSLVGKRIALLGLTFKAGTADLRESPAIAVATLLAAKQARVIGYDPAARTSVAGISAAQDPYEAVTGADAAVILTDWPEFRILDWTRIGRLMAGDVVIDTRNQLDPAALDRAELTWIGMGSGGPNSGKRSRSTRSTEAVCR